MITPRPDRGVGHELAMKITALEEYGLRCVLRIAVESRSGPLTVGEIAGHEGLTVPYVAKLMSALREAGLVDSVRGRGGGYILTRPPSEISVEDVLGALGEPLFSPAYCENHPGTLDVCTHHRGCAIRSVWQVLGEMIQSVLHKTSLADLCHQESEIARQLAECGPSARQDRIAAGSALLDLGVPGPARLAPAATGSERLDLSAHGPGKRGSAPPGGAGTDTASRASERSERAAQSSGPIDRTAPEAAAERTRR